MTGSPARPSWKSISLRYRNRIARPCSASCSPSRWSYAGIRGEHPTPAEYHERFPDQATMVDATFAADASPRHTEHPEERPCREFGPGHRSQSAPGNPGAAEQLHRSCGLLSAFNAWIDDKTQPLGRILLEQGKLDDEPPRPFECTGSEHLKLHGDDPDRSLAALSSLGPVRARPGTGSPTPTLQASLGHVGTSDLEPTIPTPPELVGTPTRAVPGSASSGRTPAAGWARSSSPTTRSCTARSRSRRSRTSTPTTPTAAPASCSKPRSPAGWSIRASSRSTAWATTPTAGPSTPCGSSRATASRTRSSASTTPTAPGRDPGERTLALRELLGRFLDVCNADRVRPQPRRAAPRPEARQHHARQVRRDPGRRLGPGQSRRPARVPRRVDAGADRCGPPSGSGVDADADGLGDRHARRT